MKKGIIYSLMGASLLVGGFSGYAIRAANSFNPSDIWDTYVSRKFEKRVNQAMSARTFERVDPWERDEGYWSNQWDLVSSLTAFKGPLENNGIPMIQTEEIVPLINGCHTNTPLKVRWYEKGNSCVHDVAKDTLYRIPPSALESAIDNLSR